MSDLQKQIAKKKFKPPVNNSIFLMKFLNNYIIIFLKNFIDYDQDDDSQEEEKDELAPLQNNHLGLL
jgi:hypothetical protein